MLFKIFIPLCTFVQLFVCLVLSWLHEMCSMPDVTLDEVTITYQRNIRHVNMDSGMVLYYYTLCFSLLLRLFF
jgi:hypothetical protein